MGTSTQQNPKHNICWWPAMLLFSTGIDSHFGVGKKS